MKNIKKNSNVMYSDITISINKFIVIIIMTIVNAIYFEWMRMKLNEMSFVKIFG